MKKKKLMIAGCIVCILIFLGTLWLVFGRGGSNSSADVVYVSQISTILGQGSLGIQQRFSGVVEPQETCEVELQPDKTVKEVLVEKGQDVSVGTPLFTYNTDQAQEDLEQAKIDVERMENEILTLKEQISVLQAEKKAAGKEEALSYTTQIQTAENDIKKTEYSIKSKKIEIEQLKYSVENATVVSEVDGIVQSINQGLNTENYYGSENSNAFITILGPGSLRVKGSVNEQNIYSVMEGQPVIIRSRVDDSVWYGTMGAVDTENQSSKYPFYVTLDSDEGLMLGQHVYIENDMGQEAEKNGLWLPDYFICDLDADPYVWADNGKGKLEKKAVVLGEYNEELMEYEILEGLTAEDAITFPEESLKEGLITEISMDGAMGMQMYEGGEL